MLAGVLTLAACFPTALLLLWASYASSLCGKEIHGAWNALPFVGAVLVFLAIGAFGFRVRQAPAIVPVALVVGALAGLLVSYLVPGTTGYCD